MLNYKIKILKKYQIKKLIDKTSKNKKRKLKKTN